MDNKVNLNSHWLGYIGILITLSGSLIAGSMRFASMETRVQSLETTQAISQTKLDSISGSLARIEGRLMYQDRWNKGGKE